MGKIHKNFFATAFCAAFLFLMSFGAFGQTPYLTTSSCENQRATTVTAHGEISNYSNVTITEVGFIYATTEGDLEYLAQQTSFESIPAESKAVGTKHGDAITATLTGLTPSTEYYCKAYIRYADAEEHWLAAVNYNSFETAGSTGTFSVGTLTVYDFEISMTDAVLRGVYENPEGVGVTERGFLYSDDQNIYTATIDDLMGNVQRISCEEISNNYFTANIEALNPATLYYYKAYVTNTNGTEYGSVEEFTTLGAGGNTSNSHNGHDYVDLGLPSGTMWATMNVGASSPEEYGDYFAWGETEPHYSVNGTDTIWRDGYEEGYVVTNYSHRLSGDSYDNVQFSKYNNDENFGIVDNLTTLEAEDDAATANWGGDWRMPTSTEMHELVDNCDVTSETQSGTLGFLFTSRNNGNSIFLPAAGWRDGTDLNYASHFAGTYWSSSCSSSNPRYGVELDFEESASYEVAFDSRWEGYSIRPVYKADNTASNPSDPTDYHNGYGYVDLGLPSGTMWANVNVGASNPEEYGDYFAWGETEPKDTYEWSTYRYCNGSETSITKYLRGMELEGITDTLSILEPSDDAATVNWGNGWSIPSVDEMFELYECTWTWTTYNNVSGFIITGLNGNSIFLPAANFYCSGVEGNGAYWMNCLDTGSINMVEAASVMYFNGEYHDMGDSYPRSCGVSIRPVYKEGNTASNDENIILQCDFEDTEQNSLWELNTTSQTNYWHIGSAVNNGGSNALYITHDGGASNEYDNTSTSYSYATIQVWIGEADNYQFDFDWMANGEYNYDNMRAFLVSLDAVPNFVDGSTYGMEGDNNTTPAGWIDLYSESGIMEGQTSWQHNSKTVALEEGGYNLVFFWKNNTGGGFDPPAAVDNIVVSRETQTASNPSDPTDYINGYGYVDLGLPSGTMWATMNVGATSPEGVGNYYAWGETETKDVYTWETYRYANGTTNEDPKLTKYCNNADFGDGGFIDDLTTLETSDDAAVANWGNGWRMPTQDEYQELFDNSDTAWMQVNGMYGYMFTGPNGNSIFFPAAGMSTDIGTGGENDLGIYWSSTLNPYDGGYPNGGGCLLFQPLSIDPPLQVDAHIRSDGVSVRPVYKAGNTASNSTGSHNGHDYVDLGLSVKWATMNVGAEAPYEEGNLYAWGEKETKSLYDWINYEHCEGYDGMINKYFTNENIGVTDPDNLTTLLPEDDAVTVNWGAGWRMPTSVEVEELINNCTINGSTISGNGNSITMNSASYWTSSLYLDNQNNAYIFDNSNGGALSNDERSSGYPVRGVYDATLALPTVITDSLSNLGATSVYLYGTVIDEDGVPTATDFGFKYGTDSQSLTETIQGDPGTVGFTATLTELQPGTTYFYRAYATNENGTGYGEIKTFTTPSGEYGGHAYIDLGLSSGTLWATCNVGADRPEGYGNYYAWGETTPKDEYTWSTYQHANGTTDDDPKLTKYCNDAGYGDGGFVDNLTTLELEDDAASVNWGTGWRMPTREEIKELVDSCIWAWEEPNGIAGYRVTSRNGNSIFLPAAGLHYADAFISEGSSANYWSNTLEQGALPIEVSNIAMFTNSYNVSGVYRYLGYSVRAIFQKSPTVITNSATEISTTTANLQGKIVSSGISDVTARGFIYGIDSENLTDSIASTDNTDEFTASISNLESGKRYYFKAFAANDDGVSYGSVRSFRTLGPPNVTVYYPEWRDTTSVSLKASVEAGGEISSNKFYIGTDRSSLSEVSGEVNFSNNDSTYTLNVYDLLPETLYWATAESEDNYGSRRGDTISFYTYGHFMDARDNTDYRTIQIGDQIWMAENLRFATDIQVGADTSSTVAYRYYPAGDEANTSTYGYLYNWKATMNGEESSATNPSGVQGICPDGWHLPSNSEWEQLENFLGSEKAASKLAGSASLWFSNYGACLMLTDSQFASSGFNAVPSGVFYTQYYVFGQEVAFWSATKYGETNNVYTRYFYATRTDLVTSDNEPVNGYSVRCVKSGAPTVATNSATSVTSTSATLNGSISDAGTAEITDRGFLFGTDSTSLTQNLQSTDNTDDFTYTLSDLTANTTYYFKAYATINGETMYGEIVNFTTEIIPITVTTLDKYEVAVTSAHVYATISEFFNITIRLNGFVYGTNFDNLNDTITNVYISSYYNGCDVSALITGLEANTTYYYCAFAVFNNDTIFGNVKQFQTLEFLNLTASGNHNGYDFVDLGLPSGTLWATVNIGATIPEEAGNYYAWGETATKSEYNDNTYIYFVDGALDKITKYCNDENSGYNGFTDNLVALEDSDDVAIVNWGNDWRMPTDIEAQELIDHCSIIWTEYNGINGVLFTGINGNSIFLPAVGMRFYDSLEGEDEYSYYSTKSLANLPQTSASIVIMRGDPELAFFGEIDRSNGTPIRPVYRQSPSASNIRDVIYSCDFEDDTENLNWILSNGDQTNKWQIGTAASNGGEKSLYISENEGSSNTFDNTAYTDVYVYRQIEITETGDYWFDFDWRSNGSYLIDYMRAFIISTSLNPDLSAGETNDMQISLPEGWIEISDASMSRHSDWQHSTAKATLETGNYYLVFYWTNDEQDGENPAGAIDNIEIYKQLEVTVTTTSATNVTTTSATINGNISDVGSAEITARGFMFGTDSTNFAQNYTSTDNTTDFTYTVTGLTENTTYYFKAYATINGETMYGDVKAFMTPSGVHDNYAYIDLGLPSGAMWATCNVGASNPEDYGNYYAWGETTTKDSYTQSNYTYSDNPTTLPAEADAVAVNWGGRWVTPTVEDLEELNTNCTSEWTSVNGVYGRVFTGPNGNSIFLPAAGRFTSTLGSAGSYGDYWSSSLYNENSGASYLYFSSSSNNATVSYTARYYGYSVRGIYRTVPTVATLSATDVSSTSAVLHGRISDIGNSEVTARGFKFGTSSDNLTETLTSTDNTDEFSYTVSDLEAGRTYFFRAFATNSDGTSYGEIKILMVSGGQQFAGHDYIDLGLPSGIMWATCNVGATSPEDQGDKYAWGETTTKDSYTQDNYTYSDIPEILPADHDAAVVVWGGGWHMPTSADFEELINNCTSLYTDLNDVDGYVFTGPNGNSIFMPRNYYWSSSLDVSTQTNAYSFSLNTTGASLRSSNRYYGDYIRGVCSIPEVALSYPVWRDSIAVSLKAKYAVNGTVQSSKYYVGTAKNNLSEVTEGVTLNGDEHLLTVNVYNLEPRTQYWAMAEIVDEYGTFRSDTLSFYTYGSFVDSRDGTSYYTIQIGDQTWMAENLKYAGDEVSLGTTASDTEPYYYYPNGDEANVETYGYLYNWPAAMNGEESSDKNPSGVQGICPNGWHLPSDAEWTQLTNYLGGSTNAGAMLAGQDQYWQTGTLTQSVNFGKSGFNALPTGGYIGVYSGFGISGGFLSATENSENSSIYAYGFSISNEATSLDRNNNNKVNGDGVRCVKGSTIYAHDTVKYCGEQYTFGTQTLTASGDYEETFNLGTDKDSVVYLHLTMNPAPTASISASTIHCSGQTATLTNTASGGTAPYTYNWTADTGITLGETSVTTAETSYNNTATPTFSECSASFSVNLSVTDANGCTANATSVTINVEREDFTMPANGNSTVACIDQATEPTPPTVNDNCGNTLTPSAAAQGGTYNGCSGTRTYTFTYTDCEGSEHDWTYTYTIERNDFDMPYDDGTTVACASVITAPTLPTVTDNCGNDLTGTLKSGYPTATPSCEGDVVYKYTFTDCDGNSHDWTYTYTIAPVDFTMPADGSSTVACATEITAPTLPAVTDNCGNVLTGTLKSGYPTETPSCNGDVVYKYTFTDCAGHNHDWTYTYTIERNIAPALSGTWPENISGQDACYADRDISGLISDDDVEDLYVAACGTISVTHSDVEVSTDNCGWTVTRTYIITDGCNQTTKTQSISGGDQTAPTIGDASLSRELTSTNCTFIVPDLTEEVRAISSDNCSANADLTITQIPVAGTEITDEIVVTVTITVTDQCGLSSTKDVTLTIPDELTTSLTAGTIACNGGTTDITNEVAGGTSPYTYYWTDDTHSQNNEGVGAGNYTVTVTDTNGCSATSSIAVTQPNALTATLSATEINCHGQTSDISNTVAGGTEPYTYHWSNDATTQDLEGVSGGTYSVTVTDSNACTATASATVNEPAELTSELAAGTATCNGGTADITNTVSGGTAPLTYIWSNGNNTQNLTGVVAGEYTVTVTDAKGCSVVKTTEITQPDVLAVTLNAGTIACNGETTTVSTEVVGGTQPYTYAWNNDATTENLTDAVAGTYSVTVTDANTCSTTAVTTITEPSELTVTISGPTSVCENTTTTLTANAQGGTTDYTYLWNTTATTSSITTPAITTETSYSVTVTDANGCSVTESVSVEIGDTPGITISDVTAICAGGTTILQANVSNAGTDYTVEWSSPDTGAGLPDILTTDAITVTPTEAGSYTYTASLTATSCSDGQTFESTANKTLTVNPLPDVTIVNNADTTVITCNTTQIELTATGGTLYQWSNGATTATTSITAPETYIVTVTDANGCTNTESITLTQDVEAPIVTITNTTGTELLTCTTTEINVEADGTGTSYLWSNDATTASNTFTEGGTYTVTATADNGCTSTANIQITPNSDAPTLSITNNTGETILTCSLTSIIVTAEGSGASYEWSNGARTAETTLTEAGTYTVTTTATNGCTASTQITITANLEEPEIIATATDSTICQGSSTTLTASGGSSYTWSPETGLPSTVGATLTASPTTTTTYTVTGIGENGCAGSGEVVITVNLPTESEITQIACESYEWNGTTYTETGDFTQTFTNANGCDSVVTLHLTINNAVTNEISDSACESYEWYGQTYTASGDYEHTLTAANGCDSVVTLHLTINQPTESNDTVSACGSYEWYGQTYTETGDYVHTLQSVNGCDSVVNLHLIINQTTESNDTVIACDNYEWFGQTYTETDDYVHTLQSVNGCDSIVNLHLIINNSSAGEFADQMCSGVPYEYEGQTFTEAGTYHVTLVNANGCDSVVTLTLTYSNSCGGIISGVITDAGTDEAIPNARVTIGNQVIRTNNNGEYSLEVVRGLVSLRVSAEEYASYYEAIDIHSDTVVNVALYKPEISMDVDSISVTTYPYLAQYDSITITNTGNTALVWSSVSDYDSLALLPYDEEAHQRRNSRSLWDSIQTFTTQFNAEQAIATDGFFIYTSSWMRPGEFNRYTPDGEYIETFYIENVGMIRNLSFDGTYFYGTEATNIIFKLDLDNQTLVDSITTDISNIRHCSFDRQNGNLLAGSWNTLYSIDTATGVSTQIRSDLMNVYSSAYDNLSPGGPYLWLFSQASQNNGPSAYIRQFSIGNADYTNKTHYLDDIGLGNASLAGGICASEYVCEGKFVLLADVQNPSGNNIIATYEIGRTNNIVSPEKKSGRIMPNESLSIGVREHAVGEGEYEAKIRYRAAVMGNRTKDVNVTVTAVAPECDAVQQIIAVTDTFYNVTLNWQPIELGEYRSVSYLIYGDNSQFALDTTTETSITFERLSVGEHCFNVRALSVGDYSCLSESSDTVCAEIEHIPCNVSLAVSASNDGESIFLTWNKPVGVEYFRIYRDDNAVEEVLYDGRYTDSNVVPEITYCYTIFAYFEDGICDEIVGTACSKIVSGVCAESPVLQIEAVGYSVHLNWTVTSDSYTYKIFRNDVAIGMTTDTTYFDNVNPGYNYCYKVESLCEYGMFAYSNEECVFVEIIPEDDDENGQGSGEGDAIDEWTADNLSVYPNPTYGQFFIEGQRIATVIIYNASGQIVVEFDNNESERISINCDGWSPGLYNIRIISVEGQVATRKVSIFR